MLGKEKSDVGSQKNPTHFILNIITSPEKDTQTVKYKAVFS